MIKSDTYLWCITKWVNKQMKSIHFQQLSLYYRSIYLTYLFCLLTKTFSRQILSWHLMSTALYCFIRRTLKSWWRDIHRCTSSIFGVQICSLKSACSHLGISHSSKSITTNMIMYSKLNTFNEIVCLFGDREWNKSLHKDQAFRS